LFADLILCSGARLTKRVKPVFASLLFIKLI
jgi:hypothetical protein